ncbi:MULTISPECIES: hypothetical protein [unclassified Gilliamella]|uniref:hypothetical protein n=1 Tax=unclassified Gilliamella TaxID=2685620 RepID=UPI001C400903|nr:hypothetical protein [Gilliamella apicola]
MKLLKLLNRVDFMPALSEYSNISNTVFNILNKKGYQIWYDERLKMYCAERNGWDFMADSPSGLLGLVSIYEFKQPAIYKEYWWKDDNKSLLDNLSRKKPKYISVTDKK